MSITGGHLKGQGATVTCWSKNDAAKPPYVVYESTNGIAVMHYSAGVRIEGVEIEDFDRDGILLFPKTLSHCLIQHIATGELSHSLAGFVVRNCTIRECGRIGVSIFSGKDILIENCKIDHCNHASKDFRGLGGINVEAENHGFVNDLTIKNCTVSHCSNGIRLHGKPVRTGCGEDIDAGLLGADAVAYKKLKEQVEKLATWVRDYAFQDPRVQNAPVQDAKPSRTFRLG